MKLALGLLVGVAACVEPASTRCGDLVCPEGTRCATVTDPDETLCVDPRELVACEGLDALAECTLPDAASDAPPRRCYDGVCLQIGCGNGRIDRLDGEVCDDRNAVTGDGCSADCRSDETCGNGVVDSTAAAEQCDDGNQAASDGCTASCTSEFARWRQSRAGIPVARSSHAMAYAIRRGRVLMFGGEVLLDPDLSDPPTYFGDTWEWDGEGWNERTPVFSPSPRSYASIAYDSRRDRVVMFGGRDTGQSFDETWEWDGARWEVVQPATVVPTERARAAMAYDAKRGVTVLYGGRQDPGSNPAYEDTWEWNGVAWTQKMFAMGQTPGRQTEATMAFDPKRGVIVLVGLNETEDALRMFEYDGTTWTPRTATPAPSGRRGASLSFDPVAQKLVLFGGQEAPSGTPLADTWTWDGQVWTQLPASAVPVRHNHAAVMDTQRRSMVLFGGVFLKTTGNTTYGDTYTWSAQRLAWSKENPRVPGARSGHSAAHDAIRGRTVMTGGVGVTGTTVTSYPETWERGSTWALRGDVAALPEIKHATMAYEADHGRVVMFGGVTPNGASDVTRTFDGVAWTTQSPPVSPPRTTSSAMTYDARRREVVLFGGAALTMPGLSSDTWIWDEATWTRRMPAMSPPGRVGHSLAYDPIRERVVMFGGSGAAGLLSDTWEWDGVTWEKKLPAHRPLGRTEASMAWHPARRRIVLFGGGPLGESTVFNDAWEWNGVDWARVEVDQAPGPRRRAMLTPSADGLGVTLFGGADAAGSTLGDTWHLEWSGPDTKVEVCTGEVDNDLDTLLGCDDPGCWARCTPTCSPGMTCAADEPRCGDGTCDPLETCRLCPADCGVCTPLCGDTLCDPGETCAGDCP